MPHPFRSVVLDEVASTNRDAFALATAGEPGPLWVVGRRQTAGRGRSGRTWASEPGNLYASLLIRLACPPAVVPQIALLSGVATADAIAQAADVAPAGLRLKWPNDVLIGQAKCAGILAESIAESGSVVAVVGIGINLAWHPANLGRAATHLTEHGIQIAADAMLELLDAAMQRWLGVWNDGANFAHVREAWLERAGPVGESCTANTGAERIAGEFLGLDAAGALMLRDDEGRHRTVTFGDVALGAAPSGGPG